MDFAGFKSFVDLIRRRQDIEKLFSTLTKDTNQFTPQQFLNFLSSEQGVSFKLKSSWIQVENRDESCDSDVASWQLVNWRIMFRVEFQVEISSWRFKLKLTWILEDGFDARWCDVFD